MSGFSADWLALREPFDRAARDEAATAFDWPALAQALRRGRADDAPIAVLDLACGTGANLRALAPRLAGAQRWLLVDHDPALLAKVPAGPPHVEVECRCLDISRAFDALPIGDSQLVTTSALLDLVAEPWLAALVGHCRAAGVALLCALTVDGRIEWSPHDPMDEAVRLRFEAHQRRAKGLGGAALGPAAGSRAAALLTAAGYRVTQARSDWQVDGSRGDADIALLGEMVDGMASAATEQDPAFSSAADAWRDRRRALLPTTRLRVGHLDLLALPQSR